MLHSDVRRRLLSAGLALAMSVPSIALVSSPSFASIETDATARQASTFTVLSRGDSGDRVVRVQRQA